LTPDLFLNASGKPPRKRARRRRRRIIAASVVVLIGGVALAAYIYKHDRTGSIYHPHARFLATPTPTLPTKSPEPFAWPFYGYTKEHTRFFPADANVRPPFKKIWVHNGGALLEFPPVIYGDRLFQLADNANLIAIDKRTGHTIWTKSLGQLSASTPAVTSNTVYATILKAGSAGGPGRVVALNSANGAIRWSRALPSESESSPLLDDGHVFIGSQSGTVYALSEHNGSVQWSYHAEGSVKASPTLSGGLLYFGDYSGHVQAIDERNGHLVWRSGSGGALLGSGTFYSTAAVDYGRVYLGNTDGRMYAYDAFNGNLDWAVQTGAYVYASPAVTNAPGLGPTVYFGSYDGTFYALNAQSGHISWQFNAGGRISGSATVIGQVVYLADLGDRRIYGLGISTGHKVFTMGTGAFDPAISDGHNVYLTGYSGLFGMEPLAEKSAAASSTPPPGSATPLATQRAGG
jgi:outer membrane protein assembly factor BamB